MNAYEKRLVHRQAVQRQHLQDKKDKRWIEVQRYCSHYENAYLALHGRVVVVRYCKGWYSVHNRRYRESKLIDMTKMLEAHKHVQGITQLESEDE